MSHTNEPTGIDLKDSQRTFVIEWADGGETRVPYRALRLACVCATCVHEFTGEQLLDPATVPEDIGIQECEPVGNYGVRIHWSDGHRTGIFTWDRLRGLV